MKKVSLVATDASPSGCFVLVAEALAAKGIGVDLLVGNGKPTMFDDEKKVGYFRDADLVLLGMSSTPALAQPEVMAAQFALAYNKKFGFYGDIPGCWMRASRDRWFGSVADAAAFYLGTSETDVAMAESVFPQAALFPTGNPLRESLAFPRYTAKEVREKLDVPVSTHLVLAPGGKLPEANFATWGLLIKALGRLSSERLHFRLVLTTHPGDPASEDQKKIYASLASTYPDAVLVSKDELGKLGLSTGDIIPGASVVVETWGMTSIGAAYQRVPVVTLAEDHMLRYMEQSIGTRSVEIASVGASRFVEYSDINLASAIYNLLIPDGFQHIRTKQEEYYPVPVKEGAAVENIVGAVEQMLR